jgi:hypothetical protein
MPRMEQSLEVPAHTHIRTQAHERGGGGRHEGAAFPWSRAEPLRTGMGEKQQRLEGASALSAAVQARRAHPPRHHKHAQAGQVPRRLQCAVQHVDGVNVHGRAEVHLPPRRLLGECRAETAADVGRAHPPSELEHLPSQAHTQVRTNQAACATSQFAVQVRAHQGRAQC